MNDIDITPMPIEKSFEELFKEQFSPVYNYIYYRVRNVMDAEDLTADVFIRAYEYWGSYCSSKGSQGAWLGGIARNMVKSYFQKEANKPQITQMPEFICSNVCVEDSYLRKEDLLWVFTQIDSLPERQRELLLMKYLLRLTNRDIAKITGLSESNVGVTLHRTIKKMQEDSRNYEAH